MLLERGADITICDKVGFTALDQAIINGNYREALILNKAVGDFFT
jgi:ankyrin repeat protein